MNYPIQPWRHQLTAIERAAALPWFALFFEMGAGKTMTAINILRHKMAGQKKYLRTVVFCPPIVVPNWKDEFTLHSKVPRERIVLLQGSSKERAQQILKQGYDSDGKAQGAFFVTNYEALLMPEVFEALQTWGPEAIIFDESHKLKNYSAKRSKKAELLANPKKGPKPLCYILSGSPVLKNPMDLFFQYLVMDGGETFGKNFFMFRARYFYDKNAGMPSHKHFPDWQILPGAVEQINALIFKYGMRVTKAECMDLPEEISVTIKCGMTSAQARVYRELKRDYIAYVEEKTVTARLAIVKALRLLQITSGFVSLDNSPGEEGDPAKLVYHESPKVDALRELLSEITPHSKVIVWAVWKENYATIRAVCEGLSIPYVEVHGGISRAQQNENVQRFKSDPTARVFLGHPGSGGIGINLVVAPYSIFFSRTFSLEHYLQARARNHRGGQTQKVTHYDLVCEGTIEEIAQENVASKLVMSESLLKDMSRALCAQTE